MDLLTERRLRYVLALRRIGEATLLRDRDKVSELMNFHRRSDTPLGPPFVLRLADRMGAVAKGVRAGGSFWSRNKKRGLCGTITLVNKLAVWFTPHEWKSTTFLERPGSARVSRDGFGVSPKRTYPASCRPQSSTSRQRSSSWRLIKSTCS